MQNLPPDPQPSKTTARLVKFTLGATVAGLLAIYASSFAADHFTAPQLGVLLAFSLIGGVVGLFADPEQIGRFFDSISWF